ncbi:MAG: CDP-diacylglycerol--serine O-phosphatidyltransferase [Zetaproteobacteria bacterium CG_4_9_14_3_um_filter_49_83]|nr:MAG: CDP-diacylglycerol--serine O-phosphatidyltransferase [Zetaproteobacteria bacterium CG1_02_49_23]PIQ30034.1 MAG: CDP-diacylglycerol--serine O-phosphatidyltransferase [Zetaproteobacteria bacterium CG17_big_fil_post_rev_8_21_14_2_50_50_13]PIV29224.1 MAG: CDP-diacylglycerol--serine O-phosphatidyltransferase [Zetaproteobacteria bacterium CG02_land_8_20_14_3_00_50_9]PIY56018.1 MAG: CDP-diacylglycerol--serine O-phosphatidyltransferase [Zetaproteobacteria bacterium CG_4_10_14_0_8_um_filter_49_80
MKKHVTLQRGIYILPSLFTSAGLFAGFYALIGAVQGRFELAAWAIIIAAIFDMLDGRVARLLNAETAFGAEYDSLCDMLSFGIAPAVLVYMWALAPLGKPGWLAAFLIAACSALRLARFNVQVGSQDKRYFQGLPTPATALLLASAVLYHEQGHYLPSAWLWWVISVALAWLMVSGVRFISGKDLDLRQKRGHSALVVMLLVIALIMLDPYRILFAIFLAYVLHGPMLSVWQHRKVKRYRISRHLASRRKREKASKPNTPENTPDA